MPKPKQLFDPYQRQVIKDLALDAWYLTPLSRAELDSDYQASQQEIAHIIGALVPEDKEHQDAPPARSTVEKTVNNSKQIPKKIALSARSFAPIYIDGKIDLSPPTEKNIRFPEVSNPLEPADMSVIEAAINDLRHHDVGVNSPKTLSGKGSSKPKWLMIIPPPTAAHIETNKLFSDSEQQLFDEVLAAIGKSWEDIYVTPLLKQSVYKHQDPSPTLLEKHLPVLQAEITTLQPKRIFLLGRIPNHAILSTQAPLSQLMSEDYQLQVGEHSYPLTVIPSLHYFLAIPAEKQLLWQRLKTLL